MITNYGSLSLLPNYVAIKFDYEAPSVNYGGP